MPPAEKKEKKNTETKNLMVHVTLSQAILMKFMIYCKKKQQNTRFTVSF